MLPVSPGVKRLSTVPAMAGCNDLGSRDNGFVCEPFAALDATSRSGVRDFWPMDSRAGQLHPGKTCRELQHCDV